jgi:hypothetical protein
MRDEQFRDVVLFVEHVRHQRLLNLDQRAIGSRNRRGDAQRPAGEASLAEEVTGAQNDDDRFLLLKVGCSTKFGFAILDFRPQPNPPRKGLRLFNPGDPGSVRP